jgi:hypothetical protein
MVVGMSIALFVIGCIITLNGLTTGCQTLFNKFFLKVVPFFGGLFIMYYACKVLGWLS